MDFDLIASEYARHRKTMLPVLDGLRDFVAGIGRKAAVLELGSGTGNYIIALAESTGCAAWGIDCAKGMLAQAPHAKIEIGRVSVKSLVLSRDCAAAGPLHPGGEARIVMTLAKRTLTVTTAAVLLAGCATAAQRQYQTSAGAPASEECRSLQAVIEAREQYGIAAPSEEADEAALQRCRLGELSGQHASQTAAKSCPVPRELAAILQCAAQAGPISSGAVRCHGARHSYGPV